MEDLDHLRRVSEGLDVSRAKEVLIPLAESEEAIPENMHVVFTTLAPYVYKMMMEQLNGKPCYPTLTLSWSAIESRR